MPNLLSHHQLTQCIFDGKQRRHSNETALTESSVGIKNLKDKKELVQSYPSDILGNDRSLPWDTTPLDGVADVNVYASHEHAGANHHSTNAPKQQSHKPQKKYKNNNSKTLEKSKKSATQTTEGTVKEKITLTPKFDKNGRCKRHNHVIMAKKRAFAKVSLN